MAESKIVSATGATATDGERGKRGVIIGAAVDAAVTAYLKEIGDYNAALKPEDYVDESGETIVASIDPKRFKKVSHEEILAVKLAARGRTKEELSSR